MLAIAGKLYVTPEYREEYLASHEEIIQATLRKVGENGRGYSEHVDLYPPDLTFGRCVSTPPPNTIAKRTL